jgi:hypothetical protein
MFTVDERDRVRERLLARAREDADVAAAAITGSYGAGGGDAWSDIDLAFGIADDVDAALARWTKIVYAEFAPIHHWDLPWGSTVYRVFLLPDWLQVDIAFTPIADFGPRGPNWRTVFGEIVEVVPTSAVAREELIGMAWLFVRHARVCIERGLPWQAEWCIANVRDHALALACLRLGLPTRYAKGVDRLPPDVTSAFEPTLISSLEEAELRRALEAAAAAYGEELSRTDAELAARLVPMLADVASVPAA